MVWLHTVPVHHGDQGVEVVLFIVDSVIKILLALIGSIMGMEIEPI